MSNQYAQEDLLSYKRGLRVTLAQSMCKKFDYKKMALEPTPSRNVREFFPDYASEKR